MLKNNVRMGRLGKEYTQSELGKHVGVTRQTIAFIEKGEFSPSVALALRIAKALEIPIAELFLVGGEQMRRLLSARSPIWQILIYVIGFSYFAYFTYLNEQGISTVNVRTWVLIWAGILFVVTITYMGLILKYNQRNPQNKIRYFGMLPPELDEQDEMFRHFAYRATRRVYIYYASVMPVLILAYVFFMPANYLLIAALGAILVGHYVLYWVTVWPVWYGSELDESPEA